MFLNGFNLRAIKINVFQRIWIHDGIGYIDQTFAVGVCDVFWVSTIFYCKQTRVYQITIINDGKKTNKLILKLSYLRKLLNRDGILSKQYPYTMFITCFVDCKRISYTVDYSNWYLLNKVTLYSTVNSQFLNEIEFLIIPSWLDLDFFFEKVKFLSIFQRKIAKFRWIFQYFHVNIKHCIVEF